jgi:hypothetical protein
MARERIAFKLQGQKPQYWPAMAFTGLALVSLIGAAFLSPIEAATTAPVAAGVKTPGLDLAYGLYFEGITLGQVDMSARIEGGDYKATSNLQTGGVVNAFWQSTINATSNGAFDSDRLVPALYDSHSVNPRRSQQVRLTYGPNGPTSLIADPPYDTTSHPVDPAQKRNTLDPLSAVVFITTGKSVNASNPCGEAAPVFDGRRRYDIALEFVKNTSVTLDNGLYSGPVMECRVTYKQIAGYEQKLTASNAPPPKIYAWIAKLQSPSEPGRTYYIPVRVWTKTTFGLVAAVATTISVDGQKLGS